MTRTTVKKLFRRCLLVAAIGLTTGCANQKQMSSLPPVEERSVVTTVVRATPQLVIEQPKVETSDTSLASETPRNEPDPTAQSIAKRWKVPIKFAEEVVKLADKHAFPDFPKRNDILAIIAVESSYKVNAFLRGCHGLMQVEKKSHRKSIAGRDIHKPHVNIEVGSGILRQYYLMVKRDKKGAVLSYNAGIGNYLKRRYKIEYYHKYQKQLALLQRAN